MTDYIIYTRGSKLYVTGKDEDFLYSGLIKDINIKQVSKNSDDFLIREGMAGWYPTQRITIGNLYKENGTDLYTKDEFLELSEQLGKGSPQVSGLISGNIVNETDPNNIIINETITTLVVSGNKITYTSEDGTVTSLVLGDRYRTNSETNNSIVSNGQLTFLVDAGLSYIPKQDVIIIYDSLNNMQGEIISYDINTGFIVIDIKHKEGSGTYSTWEINLDGIVLDQVKDWGYYKDNWSVQPLLNTNIGTGNVYDYTLNGVTRYRLDPIPYNPTLDAFYSNFDGINLTDLIVSRG